MKTITSVLIAILTAALALDLSAQPNYTELNSGVSTSLNSVCMVGNFSPTQVWVCGDNGVVLKSVNNGSNWSNVGSNGIPAAVNLITISSRANDTVLTAGNNGSTTFVYRTINGGLNWTQVFTQANGKINAIWMRNSSSGFMTGNPVGGRWSLWKTSNTGLTWDSAGMYLLQAGTETGWKNSLAVKNNNIWFGTNNSRLYRSTNNGFIWSAVSTSPEVNSTAIWIYLDTLNNTFISFGGNIAYYSTNNGSSWQQAVCPDTGKFVGFCPGYFGVIDNQPMSMYAVKNNTKIYFSNFNILNYTAEYTAPSGVYNRLASDIEVFYSMYSFAVRSNGGITRFSLFRGGAVRRISDAVPESFRLMQNYPNPFNPATYIRFSIPNSIKGGTQLVRLVVYDILGREIRILVNEQFIAGEYEVSFDASNIPSGVYFYRLWVSTPSGESGTFTDSKKMVLIK